MTGQSTQGSGYTILFLADMHVGSRWGLFPPGFVGSTGAEVALNTGQRYLLECWQRMLQALPAYIDYLILAGDIIDGHNMREEGRGLCEIDPQMQSRAACRLLEPILKRAGRIYFLRGTPYHAGISAEDEEFLAEMIQAEQCDDNRRTRPWLLLEVDGVILDVAHRQSYMIRYRSVPLEREIGFLLERTVGSARTVCVVRAHVHDFRLLDLGDHLSISLPGWKIQDAYAQSSISPNRTMPKWVGTIALRISGGAITNVTKHIFPHPNPPLVSAQPGGTAARTTRRGRRERNDHQGVDGGAGAQ